MRFVIFSIFLLTLGVFFINADQDDVPNLKQPRENIFTAGQPTANGLKQMVSRDVRIVINLRPHSEDGARDESKELSGTNVQYHSIPITPETYTMEKLEEFSCILKNNPDVPILIHCSSANRVGGMWLLYRVLVEKEDRNKALMEAREIGIKPALEPILFDFIKRVEAEQPELICRAD